MMSEDIILESNIPNSLKTELATHYIASLEPALSSDGARSKPYLPVRLSPGKYPTPLAGGWDDLNYKLLNNGGKIINQKHPKSDGLELSVGTGVYVTEVVVGQSGVWVGFLPVGVTGPGIDTATKGNQRVLYTHPEYLRKKSGTTSLALAHTLIPHEQDNVKPNITKGALLIQPDSNLNWTKLEYADVYLAYYSFDEHNKKYPVILDEEGNPTTSPVDITAAINAMKNYPRNRLSEGYYYFVTIDGTRPTVGELLDKMAPDAPGSENSPQMKEAKEDEAMFAIESMRTDATKIILEYTGKGLPENLQTDTTFNDLGEHYTVPVAQNLITNAGETTLKFYLQYQLMLLMLCQALRKCIMTI